jgi:hypothetical protein
MASNALRMGAGGGVCHDFLKGAEQDGISARQDLQNGPNAKDGCNFWHGHPDAVYALRKAAEASKLEHSATWVAASSIRAM